MTEDVRNAGLEHVYREFAERNLQVESQSGDELNVLCAFHEDHSSSMRFNVAKGVFFCHACGAKGTASALARHLGVPFQGVGRDPETLMHTLRAKLALLGRPKVIEDPIYWPETKLERFRAVPTTYWTDPLPLGRGFTQDTVDAFDLGYDLMADHGIIPIRDTEGRIVGVTRRDLSPRPKGPRYLDPKGFNKGEHLFGSWLVKQSSTYYAVLVEGPADCIKVWQAQHPCVAQYGSKLTLKQIQLLRELGLTTVVLFYDNDIAGQESVYYACGWRKHVNREGKLQWFYVPEGDLRNFFVVKGVKYPDASVKDPGEMEDDTIFDLVGRARYIGYTRS